MCFRVCVYVAIALSVLSAAPGYAASPDPQSGDPQAAGSSAVKSSPDRHRITNDSVTSDPERLTLTKDWFGLGPTLRKAGFDWRLEWSQFYQGMTQGDGDHTWRYGGHVDALVRIDLSKLGLWDGLSVTDELYWNYGDSVNGYGRTLFSRQFGALFP